MTRLADVLDIYRRSRLSRTLASRTLDAVAAAGLRTIVITPDEDVTAWAREHGARVCDDPGGGLSQAADAGVTAVGSDPWLLIHADLPMVTPHAIAGAAKACETTTVLVPSHDGGTSVIGGRGSFGFAYGVGSFQRHFACAPHATIITSPELCIDIDSSGQLESFPELWDANIGDRENG